MDGKKAHLGEARGHVCTLLGKVLPIHICEYAYCQSGWRDSGRAQWHGRRTYPSNYGFMLCVCLVKRLDWALFELLVEADFVTHETSKTIEK